MNDPYGRAPCKVPLAGTADFAWVQHMVASKKPKSGRGGVVMPCGAFSRDGEEDTRGRLIERDLLEAVIELPSRLFYSASIPACVLVFRAEKPLERKGSVLFVDGSACFETGRHQNQLRPQDIDAILTAYESGNDGESVPVRLVEHAEITENGWDLKVGRYLTTARAESITVE